MNNNQILRSKMQVIKSKRSKLEDSIILRNSNIIESFHDLDLLSIGDIITSKEINELKDKLKDNSDFESQFKALDRKITKVLNDLNIRKNVLLEELKEIEGKAGKKRLQRVSYNGVEKKIDVSSKYYFLYTNLLNQLKTIEELMSYFDSLNNKEITLSYEIDDSWVNNLSLDEKLKYYNNLGIMILLEDINDSCNVDLNQRYVVNKNREETFKRCYLEYVECLKLKKKAKRRSIFNKIINSLKSSLKLNTLSIRKNVITASVYMQLFGNFLAFYQYNSLAASEIPNDLASYEETLVEDKIIDNINIEKFVLDINLAKMGDDKIINVSNTQTEDEMDYIMVVSNNEIIDVQVIENTENQKFDGSENLEVVFQNDVLLESAHQAEELSQENENIVEGYHLTYNNTTYHMSREDFFKLLYVVQHESNGTYEDSLTVASIILNRVEDERYDATTPLEVVMATGQFQVWDEAKATYFATSSDVEINKLVYEAVNDAVNHGIRNNDYVEFKASNSSDYAKNGEMKVQFVENGNKVHNLARNLDRTDNVELEENNEVKKLTYQSYNY